MHLTKTHFKSNGHKCTVFATKIRMLIYGKKDSYTRVRLASSIKKNNNNKLVTIILVISNKEMKLEGLRQKKYFLMDGWMDLSAT